MSKIGDYVIDRQQLINAVELSAIQHDDFIARCKEENPYFWHAPNLDRAWQIFGEMKKEANNG